MPSSKDFHVYAGKNLMFEMPVSTNWRFRFDAEDFTMHFWDPEVHPGDGGVDVTESEEAASPAEAVWKKDMSKLAKELEKAQASTEKEKAAHAALKAKYDELKVAKRPLLSRKKK